MSAEVVEFTAHKGGKRAARSRPLARQLPSRSSEEKAALENLRILMRVSPRHGAFVNGIVIRLLQEA